MLNIDLKQHGLTLEEDELYEFLKKPHYNAKLKEMISQKTQHNDTGDGQSKPKKRHILDQVLQDCKKYIAACQTNFNNMILGLKYSTNLENL